MVMQSLEIDVSTCEGGTSRKWVIQLDVDRPLVNNMQVVPKPQEEPSSDTEIDHGIEFSGGVHD